MVNIEVFHQYFFKNVVSKHCLLTYLWCSIAVSRNDISCGTLCSSLVPRSLYHVDRSVKAQGDMCEDSDKFIMADPVDFKV